MGRRPCCSKEGFNRGAWTAVEDKILRDYIQIHGEGRWRDLPKKAGLKRCGKSCRLRWLNYLRPDIKRGNITQDEEELIIRLHKLLGNRWSLIAGRLPGRTDNEIKNYWNTNLGKKVEGHPSSTLIKKSNQSKEKKKKKNPPMIRPSLEAPPPPKMQSNVVRTKALRCTKVFLTPQASQVEHLDSKMTVVPSTVEGDFVTQKEIKPETYEGGLLSFTPGTDDSSDFLMDFNVGELCLSDLLDFDFSQLGHFDNGIGGEGNENDNSDLSPCSDQAPLYPEEMLEFWTGGDGIQSDIVSDLRSLASFQDGEEDWL